MSHSISTSVIKVSLYGFNSHYICLAGLFLNFSHTDCAYVVVDGVEGITMARMMSLL